MLMTSLSHRGHEVQAWSPQPKFHRLFAGSRLAKWAGYVDQYCLFPSWVKKQLKKTPADTLFVFCDQALGPWVPLVKDRPHVVHTHDLLALRSALGEIRENPTSLTGQIYQRYIRRGFRRAKHFISVSKKTREDLHRIGQVSPVNSEVVYNGLNYPYSPLSREAAMSTLLSAGLSAPPNGMILHVGGGQWYKNLPGVISIYSHYARQVDDPLPLWCIGPQPNARIRELLRTSPGGERVSFFSKIENRALQAAYSHARVLLFPSIEEGFGWPLVEALACGCPVITTNQPPMNELAGDTAHFIPRLEFGADIDAWAEIGAATVREILSSDRTKDAASMEAAKRWSRDFDANRTIDAYLGIYHKALNGSPKSKSDAGIRQ